jgi:hypothetical protein
MKATIVIAINSKSQTIVRVILRSWMMNSLLHSSQVNARNSSLIWAHQSLIWNKKKTYIISGDGIYMQMHIFFLASLCSETSRKHIFSIIECVKIKFSLAYFAYFCIFRSLEHFLHITCIFRHFWQNFNRILNFLANIATIRKIFLEISKIKNIENLF